MIYHVQKSKRKYLREAYLEQANLFNATLSEKEEIRKGLVLKKKMIGEED